MKVCCWVIGRTDEAWLKEGIAVYIKRLAPYLSFEYLEINIKGSRNQGPEQRRLAESDHILKMLKPNDQLVLLDEGGKEYNSVDFADRMQKYFNDTAGNLIFLSGGPYGFHEELYSRASTKLALSKFTFTHQMARLIFLEQLYRAMTILRNEPYHHQ